MDISELSFLVQTKVGWAVLFAEGGVGLEDAWADIEGWGMGVWPSPDVEALLWWAEQLKEVRSMSEYLWKKEEAAAEALDRPEIVKRVLVLYTGGTIGMKWTKEMGLLVQLLALKEY